MSVHRLARVHHEVQFEWRRWYSTFQILRVQSLAVSALDGAGLSSLSSQQVAQSNNAKLFVNQSQTRLCHNPEQNFETGSTAEQSHSKYKSLEFRLQTWTLDLDFGLGLARTWTWIVTISQQLKQQSSTVKYDTERQSRSE